MNFRISGQKINIMKETRYLGMIIDEHVTFKNHIDTVKLKLNIANRLLAKLRHYVNPTLLRIMTFLSPTCDMDASYGGKHKDKSYKILKKSKTKTLKF